MKDLCWFQGGPKDGQVMECEVGAFLEFPVLTTDLDVKWVRYRPYDKTPDGIVCRYVP